MLIGSGVQSVKISRLAVQLGVSRASFYWYFADRQALLDALLDEWREANIRVFEERAERPEPTVIESVLAVFECWVDRRLFDPRLEFAVRDWARRDDDVRRSLEEADNRRIEALESMHLRHGASATEARVRARVHYHSQIGLYALGQVDSMDCRNEMLGDYLRVFTGEDPHPVQVEQFRVYALSVGA